MTDSQAKIDIRKALEYVSFSGAPVNLTVLCSNPFSISAIVEDVNDSEVTLVCSEGISSFAVEESLKNQRVEFIMGFRRRALKALSRITLISNTESTSSVRIQIEIPKSCTLTDLRKFQRAPFSKAGTELGSSLVIEASGRSLHFSSNNLLDINQEALSLFLDRNVGLVLPGDRVSKISVSCDGIVVLEANGIVHRLDPKCQSMTNPETYLAVIKLNQLQASPTNSSTSSRDLRASRRELIWNKVSAQVAANHPLFVSSRIVGQVIDISTSGASFFLEGVPQPIVPGLLIRNMQIHLPNAQVITSDFKVTSLQSSSADTSTCYRIGGQFTGLSIVFMKQLSEFLEKVKAPNIVDATIDDYEELWEFFFETGFIYSSKRKQIQKYSKSMFETYRKLLHGGDSILRKILFKENGVIKGHISSIKFFDNSWIVQHLNASGANDTASAARSVIEAMTEFWSDAKANDALKNFYILFSYRPDNLYPATLFGGVKKLINSPNICDSENLRFCLLKDADSREGKQLEYSSIETYEATLEDSRNFENLLISQSRFAMMRIENLRGKSVTEMEVSKLYEDCGLYRKRRLFVGKDRKSGAVIYALCNYSSPGLNLSELTNSFRVFHGVKDQHLIKIILDKLTETVLASYQDTEVHEPVLLSEPGNQIPERYLATKIYTHWHLDIRHTNQFKNASQIIFENLKKFLKETVAELKNSKAA